MATGMDDFGIFFSDSLGGPGQNEGDSTMLKRRFREFLREYRDTDSAYIYRNELERAVTVKTNNISVQLGDISAYDPALAEQITKRPTTAFEILEDAAKQVADEVTRPRPGGEPINPDLHVQLISGAEPRAIRDLSAADVGKLVKIPGIAVSASQVRSKASVLSLRCRSCNHAKPNIKIRPGLEGYMLPRKCEAEASASRDPCSMDPYILVPELCQCRDFQNIKMQESPDQIPTAEMPRHVGLYMERSLVDLVVPGNRCTITGIYQIRREQVKGPRQRDSKKSGVGIRAAYIRVLGVEVDSVGPGRANDKQRFTREEEEMMRELAARQGIYDLISKSIAPSIYGCEDMKRSVACLLFGGSRKRLPDGNRRGDINVLLLGDPGTAKSQLLKFAERCAPVGVYTSGKGSSAAGLTAAVVRDQNRGFALEAGAMVLADGGLVCIDEFDKMRPEDRVAIHEAMEQQTISIAKAGLTTTLNSRCSVLAAANSVYGRWDDTKGEENIDFLPTILSRFDMIYVVKDIHDAARDITLAKYVMNVHTGAGMERDGDKDEIDLETLKKFIQYCRMQCGPRLNGEATKKLQNQYVLMRQGVAEQERSSGKKGAVPITVRQLEAVIRISESLAKMRLAPFATGVDVDEALRLFRTSTMAAASTGALSGVEGYETASDQEDFNRIERQIKRRFLIGSQVSEKSITADLIKQNYPERSVSKVLQIMIRRGEVQHRMQRRMLYRVK